MSNKEKASGKAASGTEKGSCVYGTRFCKPCPPRVLSRRDGSPYSIHEFEVNQLLAKL